VHFGVFTGESGEERELPVPAEIAAGQHVCSLIVRDEQTIPPNVYTLLRFPYGDNESYDSENMHALTRDGRDHPYPSDPVSGLIFPAHDAWAQVYGMVQWASDDDRPAGERATEYRDQIVRDPLGAPDSTCTQHRPASPGIQCFAKSWGMFVHPDVPLGLLVAHNAASALRVTLAEFKIAYRT
jgi:hypothetical protein